MPNIYTDANFQKEVMESKEPVLVDFWAPWCGPCKMIGPIVEQIAGEFDGKGAKIGKMNVDENQMTPSKYGIMSIPTLLIFKNGAPVAQFVGVTAKEKLVEKLKEAMA